MFLPKQPKRTPMVAIFKVGTWPKRLPGAPKAPPEAGPTAPKRPPDAPLLAPLAPKMLPPLAPGAAPKMPPAGAAPKMLPLPLLGAALAWPELEDAEKIPLADAPNLHRGKGSIYLPPPLPSPALDPTDCSACPTSVSSGRSANRRTVPFLPQAACV